MANSEKFPDLHQIQRKPPQVCVYTYLGIHMLVQVLVLAHICTRVPVINPTSGPTSGDGGIHHWFLRTCSHMRSREAPGRSLVP